MKSLLPETIAKDDGVETSSVPNGFLNIAPNTSFADGGLCARLNGQGKPTSVLVAEHRTIVRQGICAVLGLEKDIRVIAEASDGDETATLTEKLHPDVVVISVAMAFLNRMQTARRMSQALPAPRLIILARQGDDTYVQQAASLGAAAYLTEQVTSQALAAAIRDSHKGRTVIDPGICLGRTQKPRPYPASAVSRKISRPLTARQRQVLQLIAEGNSNKQTASDLAISIKTVEKHRENIMAMLGIHETAGSTM